MPNSTSSPRSCDGNVLGSPLILGGLRIRSRCVLAPLSGVSDLPFRLINRSLGCELAFAQMINARALMRSNSRTVAMLASCPLDRPLGVQLLGADPQAIVSAVKKLQDYDIDFIDINAACPARKVVKRGEGAYLLTMPRTLGDLLRAAVRCSRMPVTVKIRTGWDTGSRNAREIARCARDAGVTALFIHGRTRAQGFSGDVDYQAIREAREEVDIPVIASGDGLSPQLIKKMFDDTGCDGVAIARGALGNPWIFRRAAQFISCGTVPPPPEPSEIAHVMRVHLVACSEQYGEEQGPVIFRKHFTWYTKGLPGAKALRQRVFSTRTMEEMARIIQEVGSAV